MNPPSARRGCPIDHDNAADVLDVILSPDERTARILAFLLLDGSGYLVTPFVVEDPVTDVPREARVHSIVQLFSVFAQELEPGGRVVFARGREGSLLLRDEDRQWHQIVLEAAAETDTSLVGSWLATDAGIRAFPAPLAEEFEESLSA